MDEDVEKSAENDAESGGVNAKAGRKKVDTNDGAEVIQKRGESGDEETALGLEDTG